MILLKRMAWTLILVGIFGSFTMVAYAKDYVIGGGDTLNISVWGSPELSIDATVRPDGKISLPALGEIKASGLTPVELTNILEKEMKRVVKTPIVTVIVTGMTNYNVYVVGRGAPAGVHSLTRQTSLLEFLSRMGSLANADLENSYLVRQKMKIKENFYDLFEKGDFSQDMMLEPNDMLFIPDNFEKRIRIVGAVNNPATIPYREGLTITDVILSAGGFTQFARENKVKIIRTKDDGSKRELSVRANDLMKDGEMEQNIAIMPGDFVIVREKLF